MASKATKKPAKAKKAAKPRKPNKGGRPSKYTPKLVEDICARLAKGEPLAQICRDEGMPHPSTVRDWMDAKPDVSRAIARAREDGEDWIAAECLAIADTPLEGEETKLDESGKVVETKRGDMLQHRKLQIETRLKLLAKWNPRKWGEKVAVGGAADLPPIKSERELTDAELAAIASRGDG